MLSDSEQEGPDSQTPELDQLILTAEEQMDYDSFALASPSVTNTPFLKFAEESPSSSQSTSFQISDRPQAQTVTNQAQPLISTPAKPSGIKTKMQASAQAWPQAPAQAQVQGLAQTQPPRPAQAYFP